MKPEDFIEPGEECVNPYDASIELEQAYVGSKMEEAHLKGVIERIKVLHRLAVSTIVEDGSGVAINEQKFINLYSEKERNVLKQKINELIDEL